MEFEDTRPDYETLGEEGKADWSWARARPHRVNGGAAAQDPASFPSLLPTGAQGRGAHPRRPAHVPAGCALSPDAAAGSSWTPSKAGFTGPPTPRPRPASLFFAHKPLNRALASPRGRARGARPPRVPSTANARTLPAARRPAARAALSPAGAGPRATPSPAPRGRHARRAGRRAPASRGGLHSPERGGPGGGGGRRRAAARTSPPARRPAQESRPSRRRGRRAAPVSFRPRPAARQSAGGGRGGGGGRGAPSPPRPDPARPAPPPPPGPGPLPAPPAPHPGTIFARSGTARPAGPKPLTGVAARLALLGLRGAAPRHRRRRRRPTPRPHTHSHTYTRRSAHARGPAAGARRAPDRAAEAGGTAGRPPSPGRARGPHGGKAPERPKSSAGTAPTSAGSMARWAAVGARGAGARWGRGAARCACALPGRAGCGRRARRPASPGGPGPPAAGLTGGGPPPPGGPDVKAEGGGPSSLPPGVWEDSHTSPRWDSRRGNEEERCPFNSRGDRVTLGKTPKVRRLICVNLRSFAPRSNLWPHEPPVSSRMVSGSVPRTVFSGKGLATLG